MPTASTGQILGFNECFEPYTSNIYTRRVLAGEFQVVCPWLLRELVGRRLWDDHMKNLIIANGGSVQNIPGIPDDVRAIYKTIWEISQKKVLDMAADRGAFICQSQRLNVHLQSPTMGQLTSMHFYGWKKGWKKGLKTGMYYLRTRPAAQAIQLTVDAAVLKEAKTARSGAVAAPVPSPIRAAVITPSLSPNPEPAKVNGVNGITNGVNGLSIKEKPVWPKLPATPLTTSERSAKAAAEDPEYAAGLKRLAELDEARLICSRDNPEGCVMCSG